MSVTTTNTNVGPITVTGFPTVIPVTFQFNLASDLVVVDLGPSTNPFPTPLTLQLNSDYTVSGGGYDSHNDMQTGSVSVTNAGINHVSVNDQIFIYRSTTLDQETSFLSTGSLTAAMIEQALDKLTTESQDTRSILAKKIGFSLTDPINPSDIAYKARFGKLLGFSPTGDVALVDPSSLGGGGGGGGGSSVNGAVINITALQALSVGGLATGYQVLVSGYSTRNDGGSGLFVYDSSSSASTDYGTIITPNSGSGRWFRMYSGAVNVKWFGAKGDGVTNDAPAINLAIGAVGSAGGGALYLPKGIYYITDHVNISYGNVTVFGDGLGETIIKVGAWVCGLRVSNGYPSTTATITNVSIRDISIDGNRSGYTNGPNDTYGNGINLNSVDKFVVERVEVYNQAEQGIVSTFWGPTGTETAIGGIIKDCRVSCRTDGSQRIAIGFEGHSQNVTASNNTITDGVLYFGNSSETLTLRGFVCQGNSITGTVSGSTYGIFLENSFNNFVISGNYIRGYRTGIQLGSSWSGAYGGLIDANNIYDCGDLSSIQVFPMGTTDAKITISNNVINTTKTGYGILASAGCVINSNEIICSTSSYGIYLSGACSVSVNRINTGSIYSLRLPSSGTASLVSGNLTSGPIDNQFNGVLVGNYRFDGSRHYNSALSFNQNVIAASNTPPSTGTWNQGDCILNQTATDSGIFAWQCTSPGAPGVWTPLRGVQDSKYNVKIYGAVGDGTTDDTAAIQSAIHSALTSPTGSGCVFFPEGTYLVTTTLHVGTGSEVTGSVIFRGISSIFGSDPCRGSMITSSASTLPIIDIAGSNVDFETMSIGYTNSTVARSDNVPIVRASGGGYLMFNSSQICYQGSKVQATGSSFYCYNSIFTQPNGSTAKGYGLKLINCGVFINGATIVTLSGPCIWLQSGTGGTTSNSIANVNCSNGGSAYTYSASSPGYVTSSGSAISVPLASGHNFHLGDFVLLEGFTSTAFNGWYRVGSYTSTSVSLVACTGGTAIPSAGNSTGAGTISSIPCCFLLDNTGGAYNEGRISGIRCDSNGGPYTSPASAAFYIDGRQSDNTISGWQLTDLWLDYTRVSAVNGMMGLLITGDGMNGTTHTTNRIVVNGLLCNTQWREVDIDNASNVSITGHISSNGNHNTGDGSCGLYVYAPSSSVQTIGLIVSNSTWGVDASYGPPTYDYGMISDGGYLQNCQFSEGIFAGRTKAIHSIGIPIGSATTNQWSFSEVRTYSGTTAIYASSAIKSVTWNTTVDISDGFYRVIRATADIADCSTLTTSDHGAGARITVINADTTTIKTTTGGSFAAIISIPVGSCYTFTSDGTLWY